MAWERIGIIVPVAGSIPVPSLRDLSAFSMADEDKPAFSASWRIGADDGPARRTQRPRDEHGHRAYPLRGLTTAVSSSGVRMHTSILRGCSQTRTGRR
jgi:hypothetical protein